MAQERIIVEGSRWLEELRAALGEELVDVGYRVEGDAVDFVIVYAHGGRDAAGQRFTDAMLRARGTLPPFESISFEDGQVPGPWSSYPRVSTVSADSSQ